MTGIKVLSSFLKAQRPRRLGSPRRTDFRRQRLRALAHPEPVLSISANPTSPVALPAADCLVGPRTPTWRGPAVAAKPSGPPLLPHYPGTAPVSALEVDLESPGGEIQSLSKDLIISKDLC